jgi:hypothetical protein
MRMMFQRLATLLRLDIEHLSARHAVHYGLCQFRQGAANLRICMGLPWAKISNASVSSESTIAVACQIFVRRGLPRRKSSSSIAGSHAPANSNARIRGPPPPARRWQEAH